MSTPTTLCVSMSISGDPDEPGDVTPFHHLTCGSSMPRACHAFLLCTRDALRAVQLLSAQPAALT